MVAFSVLVVWEYRVAQYFSVVIGVLLLSIVLILYYYLLQYVVRQIHSGHVRINCNPTSSTCYPVSKADFKALEVL